MSANVLSNGQPVGQEVLISGNTSIHVNLFLMYLFTIFCQIVKSRAILTSVFGVEDENLP